MADLRGPHYIIMPPRLEQWARRAGAQGSEWQREVFEDIVHEGGFAYRSNPNARAASPSIEIIGARFSVRAGIDHRRHDSLHVFDIRAAPRPLPPEPARASGRWLLSPGPRAPESSRIMLPELVAHDAHNAALDEALWKITQRWPEGDLQELIDGAPREPKEQLERMRSLYRGPLSTLVAKAIGERGRMILTGQVTPTDLSKDIVDLRSRLDARFVAEAYVTQPASLETVLRLLLAMPPSNDVVELIREVNRRGAARSAPVPLGARHEHGPEQATSSPFDNSPVVHAEPRSVRDTDGGALLARSQLSQMRARLIEFRSGFFGEIRARIASLAQAIVTSADQLQRDVALLPDHESYSKVMSRLALSRAALDDLAKELPSAELVRATERDVDDFLTNFAALPRFAGAIAWLDDLDSWDDAVALLAHASDPALAALPEWFLRALCPTEQDLAEAILTSLAQRATRQRIDETLAWHRTLSSNEQPVDLRPVEPGEGVTPLAQLRAGYDAAEQQVALRRRFDGAVGIVGGWGTELWLTTELPRPDLVASLEALAEQVKDATDSAPHLAADIVGEMKAAHGLRDAHERMSRIESSLRRTAHIVQDLRTLAVVHQVADMAANAGRRESTPAASPELVVGQVSFLV